MSSKVSQLGVDRDYCTDESHWVAKGQDITACLEETLRQIQETKKNLHLNGLEAKSQIRSNVGRLLEVLRSREVWLLNQVELIQSAKEEVLHSQEDRLNQMLGAVKSCMDLLEKGIVDRDTLVSCMKIDEDFDLHPEETPHISFRADLAAQRQAIHQFGRVDARGPPIDVFADARSTSSSLPKRLEEYDDGDHHVLYKTVHEIYEKKHGNRINFTTPRTLEKSKAGAAVDLSVPQKPKPTSAWVDLANSDWCLINPTPNHRAKTASVHSGRSSEQQAGVRPAVNRFPGSVATNIHQWLNQIKTEVAEDDECGSSITDVPISGSASECSLAVFNPLQSYSRKILSQPTSVWVHGGVVPKEKTSAATYAVDYFDKITRISKGWLLHEQKRNNAWTNAKDINSSSAKPDDTSLAPSADHITYFRNIQRDKTQSWLRSVDSTEEPIGSTASSDEKLLERLALDALKRDEHKDQTSDAGVEIILNQLKNITGRPRSHWLANSCGPSSESAKVSSDVQSRLEDKCWLAKSSKISPPSGQREDIGGYLQRLQVSPESRWVYSRTPGTCNELPKGHETSDRAVSSKSWNALPNMRPTGGEPSAVDLSSWAIRYDKLCNRSGSLRTTMNDVFDRVFFASTDVHPWLSPSQKTRCHVDGVQVA